MLMSNSCPSFETPPTNTAIKEKRFLNFHPISAITPSSNMIHFLIKGHSLKYVDLQKSQLYIRKVNCILGAKFETLMDEFLMKK